VTSSLLARCWDLQARIESRAREAATAYRGRRASFTGEEWAWIMSYICAALLAGVAIGAIIWGPL